MPEGSAKFDSPGFLQKMASPPIQNVNDLYGELSQLVTNITNVWSWGHTTTTLYRVKLPHRVTLRVRKKITNAKSSKWNEVLMRLKLQWLLKLHSAMCEIDYGLCSLRRFFDGLLTVMMRETVDVGGDSVLENKVSKEQAALSLDLLINDFIAQLQTSLGSGFGALLSYVASADPSKAIMASPVEPVGILPVASTHEVRQMLDDIFITYTVTTLEVSKSLYSALSEVRRFGLPLPDTLVRPVYHYEENQTTTTATTRPLENARVATSSSTGSSDLDALCADKSSNASEAVKLLRGLMMWGRAVSFTTRKKHERMAQRAAIILVALVELRYVDGNHPIMMRYLRKIATHHFTFPEGLRRRVTEVLPTICGMSEDTRGRLVGAAQVNSDLPILTEGKLLEIRGNEMVRLRLHHHMTGSRVDHLTLPPARGPPAEDGQICRYWKYHILKDNKEKKARKDVVKKCASFASLRRRDGDDGLEEDTEMVRKALRRTTSFRDTFKFLSHLMVSTSTVLASTDWVADAIARHEAPIKREYLIQETPVEKQQPVESSEGESDEEDRGTKRKRTHGQNKTIDRKTNLNVINNDQQLCTVVARGGTCVFGDSCKFNHDARKYWMERPVDLPGDCPFPKLLDGCCPFGLNCRMPTSHTKVTDDGLPVNINTNEEDGAKIEVAQGGPGEALDSLALNSTTNELRLELRGKKYSFPGSKAALNKKPVERIGPVGPGVKERVPFSKLIEGRPPMLAPLTTVGNLPFRRLCVSLGCEITVSEMALAESLLKGNRAEHALLKKHPDEKIFGIQIAGGFPDMMSRCAEMLCREMDDFDFLDINMACPLEGLHKKGAGSALMARMGKAEGVIGSMSQICHAYDKNLTVKLRTAHFRQNHICDKVAARAVKFGADGVVLHGRTSQQRYSKPADWSFHTKCRSAMDDAVPDNKVPLVGCGDIISWKEAVERLQTPGVNGVMIGRGALIKPWIFTEIKEHRDWDISSSERFELLKRFVSYGLTHWGTDSRGVESTRRFLLEALSFMHRYIPLGLMEEARPMQIGWRPPRFRGRDDLETLMASSNSEDWIRLSELLICPAPEGFTFVPKHKSNSYDALMNEPVYKTLGI
ncbi:tRNA-dihydrouridine(47) synthase [NAD(P)(+)]-like protein [Perkinsus chesapeaki]|uniref:tRNA-dihydrouridine(47) synthase [NAD(P)(+)] n=1 Tax=Perkinsus chesapeaki TaxID=330153 RepID=A0A7J6M6V4_PERCH|nr:tRNA-dihydrouridine(47) synthase [NAD(P)(+)]-like protein [Perkinsus chesapeaki]